MTTTAGRRPRPLAALLLAGVLSAALAGCGDDDPDGTAGVPTGPDAAEATEPTGAPGPDDRIYVAMGDSYASAPGVPTTDTAAGCFRSDHNYAHVVADTLDDVFLVDATCSGADSDDVLEQQVDALDDDTDIVTIGIGGNDFDLFSQIIAGCVDAASADPEGDPCTEEGASNLADLEPQIRANIGSVLDTIAALAPNAEVIVVGYPSLVPESGTCPDLLPIAAGDYPFVRAVNERLSAVLRDAAKQRRLPFIDVFTASQGHDICSDDPWVNGKDVAPDGTVPFHPFAEEQAAIGALIAARL